MHSANDDSGGSGGGGIGQPPNEEVDRQLLQKVAAMAKADPQFRDSLLQQLNVVRNDKETKAEEDPVVPELTFAQWWRFAIRTAVPFFGFGICDNLIMISVGDLIDTHFGVTLGFSTMVAAGLGQAVSDGSGITIQGMIEACSDKLRLPNPHLTEAQKSLPRVLFWQQVFRTIGIVCGCLCGLIPVILFDTGNRPRLYDQLLGVLPEDQRRALSAHATYVTVPEGTALFTYGTEADAMYLLQRGEVEVRGRRDNGTTLVICRETAGATLGVVELAYRHLCVADVVVTTPDAKLVKIDRHWFDLIVDKRLIEDVVTQHVEEEDSFVVYRARHLRRSAASLEAV